MAWKPPHWLALVIASMACWLERQAGAQIEYLKAENRALRSRLAGRRVLFTDAGRRTLGALANEIGTTALRELNPIVVAGERDAVKLAKLLDGRIRASEEDIVKSLQGSWRAEHLFAVKQAVSLYDSYQTSITECDAQLAKVLGRLAVHDDAPEPPKSGRGRRPVKVEKFDLRKALDRELSAGAASFRVIARSVPVTRLSRPLSERKVTS